MEHKCHCIVRFTRYMSENSCKLTYPAVFYAMTYGADNRTRTCMLSQWNLNPSCLPIPPYPHLEQVTRIELASSEWKSDVLAIVRHLHKWQLSTSPELSDIECSPRHRVAVRRYQNWKELRRLMVLEKGFEPSRSLEQRILSPWRLPVPPLQHILIPLRLHYKKRDRLLS